MKFLAGRPSSGGGRLYNNTAQESAVRELIDTLEHAAAGTIAFMKYFKYLTLCLVLLSHAAVGQDADEYGGLAGQRVAVFEHADLNYRLDLGGAA